MRANGKTANAGYGTYTHFDGTQYEGQWYEDKQSGQGHEVWTDGATYKGSYLLGKRDGKGLMK